MGRNARIGLFLLMGLIVALARLVEVEVGKARPQDEPPPVPLAVRHAKPVVSPHPRRARHTAPVARPATPAAPEPAPASPVAAATDEDAEWPNGPVYVVKKGETLGTIAQKVLGTSKLANKLYEANADRIPSPTAMKAGTRLVIPKGGE